MEVLGKFTDAQLRTLRGLGVCRKRSTLRAVRAKLVRYRGREYLGFPAVRLRSWKLWAISAGGHVQRTDRGKKSKLVRLNVGPASFIAPHKLKPKCPLLLDVEGESDLLSAIDAGFTDVMCSTTGASGTAAYENAVEFLEGVRPDVVAIVRDLDEPGDRSRDRVAAEWHQLGRPIQQIHLPASLGPGGDLRDFLKKRGRDELALLLEAAPREKPPERVSAESLTPYLRSGPALQKALKAKVPESQLPGFFDPEPGLHLVSGPPKGGKTTYVLNIVCASAAGIEPWRLAPRLPRGRVLVYSNEQTTRRIVEILDRMFPGRLSPQRLRDAYARISVFAKDQREREARAALQLDDNGMQALRATLQEARDERRPFTLLILDSLSRLKPADCDENSNDDMTAWLDRLVMLSLEFKLHIILIHHTGHEARSDARTAARGASAMGAVASVLWTFERDPSNPRQRIVHVAGSMIEDGEHHFLVSEPPSPESHIDFIRLALPSDGLDLGDFLKPDEELTASELDRRILRVPDDKELKDLSQSSRKRARAIRQDWYDAGRLEMQKDGSKKLYRRAPDESAGAQ